MSDSEDSTVTYTEVSSPFEDPSDIGSPRVDGLPMMPEDPYAYVEAALQAPPSPDYVPGPKHPLSPAYAPEFVSEPVYPEFMPPEDDVLPAEEQPLPAAVSPTADSPGYISESDPEEDPKEDDEDLEDDPFDYLTNKDDDDGEEDEESFIDEADDEEEMRTRMRTRRSTQLRPTLLLATPTLPPSPLSSLSSPLPLILSPLPQILSPPLPISSPSLPVSPTYPLGYKAVKIRLRVEAPFTSHPLPSSTPPSGTPPLLLIPLPTSSPPLLLPSTSHRADVLEKRLCIALGLRFEVDDEIRRDPKRDIGYGITDTWDEMVDDMLGTPAATNMAGLSQRMTVFVTTVRQDTD
nr:hypothetical protein [Tanacetum cinerariifolium]